MDMRDVKDLIINKAILHILNNKEDELTLNDFELDLGQKLSKIFENHIKNSINDENTRIAKFQGDINVVRNHCQLILEKPEENFIRSTQQIAKQLYDSMKSENISSANFAVCLYSVGTESYLALLKMDFSELIETETITVNGKTKISVVVKGQGIPPDKQKLQKCIFYKPYNIENEYDIILLDRQATRAKKDKLVADFFAVDFLHCELAKNNKDIIRSFKKATEQFLERNFSNDLDRLDGLKDLLYSTLKATDTMDINAYCNTAFGDDDELKDKFKNVISVKVGDFSFEVDKDWVDSHLKKKVYKTNTGIKIDIDVDTASNPNRFEIKHNDNNTFDIIIKNVDNYTQKII
jgi:hypothetical protein